MKMKTLKTLTVVSLILGIITLISMLFSHLALTDIYHNIEPNLNTEWNVVRVSSFSTLIFIVISLITIWKLSKK